MYVYLRTAKFFLCESAGDSLNKKLPFFKCSIL